MTEEYNEKWDYDHRNITDMLLLAARFSNLRERQFNAIAPAILTMDLMRPIFLMRLAVKIIRWWHGIPEAVAWIVLYDRMKQRGTDIFAPLRLILEQHLKNRDFDRGEVNYLVVLVNAAEEL